MALNDYVTLNITQNTVGPTRAGFGTGMHLSYTAAWAERTRTYSQLTDVAVDFPTTTGPEYRAATAYFSQNPAPAKLMIGRGANKPTKIVQLSAVAPTANLSYAYKVAVKGTGFADTTVTFTSDATPTDGEYAAGMVIALNAVVGKNFTAAGVTSPVTITGNTPGAWFSIEVLDVNYQTTTETTADPGIAADLTAITAENSDWYALHTAFNSKLYGIAAATWIEANSKIYTPASNDTVIVNTATTGTADIMDQAKTNAYTRTLVTYHRDPSSFSDAAILGKCLPYEPGSETWAFKTLAGVPSFAMTGTHRANIIARNGNSYESTAGVAITFQGKVGSGDYLDITRGLDWLRDDMSKAIFGALIGSAKIPYTDAGIAVIESQVRGSLRRAADKGIILDDFTVTVPTAASVAAIDKASRTLNNVKFKATTQGAVHKGNVNGAVSA